MRDEEAPHGKETATNQLEAAVDSHAKAPTVHLNLNVRGLSPSATRQLRTPLERAIEKER